MLWHAEIDPAAARVLAHHHPQVPNLGDITAIDFWQTPVVDWLTAGYPCQPFSDAGLRKGTDDDRHLWPWIAHAIRILRPRYVLLENVPGHVRRGFREVVAGLAAFGYVGSWTCVRASDLGAAHRRNRLFVVAADASCLRHGHPWQTADGRIPARVVGGPAGTTAGGGSAGNPILTLLPTPRSVDATGPNVHGDGGLDLRSAIQLIPTPRASDGTKGSPNQHGSSGDLMLSSAVPAGRFGAYSAAITRWEAVHGVPAPAATDTYPGGSPLLSPRFVEWMLGVPAGWVTGAPRMSRNDALRVLGNGVMPLQAEHAVGYLTARLPTGT